MNVSLLGKIAIDGISSTRADLAGLRNEMTNVGGAANNAALKMAQAVTLQESETAKLVVKVRDLTEALSANRAELDRIAASGKASADELAVRRAVVGELEQSLQSHSRQLQQVVQQEGNWQSVAGRVSGALRTLPGVLGDVAGGMADVATSGAGAAAVIGAGIGAAALAGAAALKNAADEFVNYTVAVVNASDRLQVSTEWFSRFVQAADDASIAARGVGMEAGQVAGALERFEMMTGRAEMAADGLGARGGQLSGVFERLGVSLDTASGEARAMPDVLGDVAEGISRIDSASEQAAIAKKLGLYELLPILRQGRAGMDDMIASINDARVVTETHKEQVLALKKAEDDLSDSVQNLKLIVGGGLVPALGGAANELRLWVEWAQRASKETDGLVRAQNALKAAIPIVGWAYAVKEQRGLEDATKDANRAFEVQQRRLLDLNRMDYGGGITAYQQSIIDARRESFLFEERLDATGQGLRDMAAAGALTISGLQYLQGEMANSERYAAQWQTQLGKEKALHEAAELSARQHATAVQGLWSAVGQPLPSAPQKPSDKLGMVTGLISGGTTPEALEMKTLAQAAGEAANAGVGLEKLADIMQRVGKPIAEGGISVAQGIRDIIAAAPASVDRKLAPVVQDLIDAERIAGKGGGFTEFAGQIKTVQAFVKGSSDAADQLKVVNGKLASERAEMAKLGDSNTIWRDAEKTGDTKKYPGMWTPAQVDAAMAQHRINIKKLEEEAHKLERDASDHYVSALDFSKDALKAPSPLPLSTKNVRTAQMDAADVETGGADVADAIDRRVKTTLGTPEQAQDYRAIGADMVRGIAAGAADPKAQGELAESMVTFHRTVIAAQKAFLEVKSPSGLLAREVGEPMVMGIVEGVRAQGQLITVEVQTAVKASLDWALADLWEWRDAGSSMAKGVAEGIRGDAWRITSAIQDAVRAAITTGLLKETVDQINRKGAVR